MNLVINKISRAFALTQDLVEYLDEANLQLKLPNLPSNTIGEQFWCMVGARESYLKAIQKMGGWILLVHCKTQNPNQPLLMQCSHPGRQ